MKLLKELINKVKTFWNIYGGIIASKFIAWLNDFSKNTMDTWTSYLVLTLTCISVLTFFKIMLFKQKTNGLIDTAAMSQQSVKALKAAVDPVKQGEELGKTILTTVEYVKKGNMIMEKIKKIIKWIWGNKFTLISIVSNLIFLLFSQFLLYSGYLKDYQFFQEHNIVFKVVVTILCLLWLINNIYTAVTNYGLESLEQLRIRAEEIKVDVTNKLTPEQRKILKNTLSTFNSTLKGLEAQLVEIDNQIDVSKKVMADINMLGKIGITLSASQEKDFYDAQDKVKKLETEKNDLEAQKLNTENQIEKITNALA